VTIRFLSCLAVLAFLAAVPAQAAPGAQKPVAARGPEKQIQPGKDAEWTEADYKAVRERDEARQRLWDRKMKALTESICTGC
jgi:hypothetical protein